MKIMAEVLRGLQNGIGRDKRMLVLARILLFMNEKGQAPLVFSSGKSLNFGNVAYFIVI